MVIPLCLLFIVYQTAAIKLPTSVVLSVTEVELEDQRGVYTRLLSKTQGETTHFFH